MIRLFLVSMAASALIGCGGGSSSSSEVAAGDNYLGGDLSGNSFGENTAEEEDASSVPRTYTYSYSEQSFPEYPSGASPAELDAYYSTYYAAYDADLAEGKLYAGSRCPDSSDPALYLPITMNSSRITSILVDTVDHPLMENGFFQSFSTSSDFIDELNNKGALGYSHGFYLRYSGHVEQRYVKALPSDHIWQYMSMPATSTSYGSPSDDELAVMGGNGYGASFGTGNGSEYINVYIKDAANPAVYTYRYVTIPSGYTIESLIIELNTQGEAGYEYNRHDVDLDGVGSRLRFQKNTLSEETFHYEYRARLTDSDGCLPDSYISELNILGSVGYKMRTYAYRGGNESYAIFEKTID